MIFTDRIITDLTSHSAIQCRGYQRYQRLPRCLELLHQFWQNDGWNGGLHCSCLRLQEAVQILFGEMFIHGPQPGIVVLLCLRLESLDLCFQPGAV
jgi:hypothetical protein